METYQDFAYALVGVLLSLRNAVYCLTAAVAVVAAAATLHVILHRKRRR